MPKRVYVRNSSSWVDITAPNFPPEASTSSAGIVQLSDSVSTTSSTFAATATAVKTANDNALNAVPATAFSSHFSGSSSVQSTVPRWAAGSSVSNANNQIVWTYFSPVKTITVSNIGMRTSTTASAGATLIRMGIYTRSGSTMTLVARTANDPTIFSATNTTYTRALDTTGGYPATYTLVAGTAYWLAYVMSGATTVGTLLATPTLAGWGGALTFTDGGPTDLPTSTAAAGASALPVRYIEVS